MPFLRAVPKRDSAINTYTMTQEDLELIKYYQSLTIKSDSKYQKSLDRMIAYCELCMKLNENN